MTIEDAAELQLRQTHVARMETRPANVEGVGAVTIRNMVINALRMRPDRIIVGEVRGEEALDMMQAMNTGHDGSLTTIHANSPRDAVSRIEVMLGSRRVTHITECVGMEGDVATTQDIFVFEKTGITEDGRITGRFRATGVRPRCYEKLKTAGHTLPTTMFQTVVDLS